MPYLGKSPNHGNFTELTDVSGSFDGSTTQFALTSRIGGVAITPVIEAAVLISINGVIQEPTTDYTVSGTNITFTSAPASTDSFFGTVMGFQLDVGTPSDGTVTQAKLASTFMTGASDIGAAIADADLIFVDDGASGTLRKATASRFKTYIGGNTPSSADGQALGSASLEWSDLYLADGGIIYFGNDQEIKVTHVADTGLTLKHTATGDDKPIALTLQTGETDIAVNDVIGKIDFQAPDEGTGTDAILVAAAIEAVAEGTFAADNNATKLGFKTGASEAAAEKMSLSSVGNVTMKNTATGDDTPMVLTLQTGETDIAANDVLGQIDFQAPDEGTGTDAILVAAGIAAVSEGDFSSSNNATKLSFKTGASEAASEKMSLSSAGLLTIADDLMIKDGGTIGVASTNDAMTIASTGIVTFKDDIVIKDGGTIGTGTTPAAMTVAAGGAVTFSAVPLFPNDTVETADIQDNAVTLAKMAGLARGKIIYGLSLIHI